jgi:hypothetical protein
MKLFLKIFFVLMAIVLLLFVIAFGCVLALEKVIPGIASDRLKAMTGYKLDIGDLDLGLTAGSVKIEGLTLRNPEGWPEEGFVTINKVFVDIDPASFTSDGRKVIEEVVIDIGPICVVTNKDDITNVRDIASKFGVPAEEEKPAEPEVAAEEGAMPEFVIHHLVIRTTKVRFADYSGAKPDISNRALALEIEMNDVTDLKQIYTQVTLQAGPQLLLMLSKVQLNLGGDSDDEDDIINSVAEPLQNSINGLFDSIRERTGR